jgi:hypothetical protein
MSLLMVLSTSSKRSLLVVSDLRTKTTESTGPVWKLPPSNSFQSHENSFTRSHRTDKWHDGTPPWFIRFSKFSHHSFWHDYGHDSSSEGQGPNVIAHSSNYDSRSSSVRDVEAVEVRVESEPWLMEFFFYGGWRWTRLPFKWPNMEKSRWRWTR